MYDWLQDVSLGRDPFERRTGFCRSLPKRRNNRTVAALLKRGYLNDAGGITEAGTQRLGDPNWGKNS